MSLHIESTDEALMAIRREKRKAHILTAFVTIMSIGSLILALYLCKILIILPEQPQISVISNEDVNESQIETPVIEKTTTSSSSAAMASVKVVVSAQASDFSVPAVDFNIDTPTETFGASQNIGLDGFYQGEDTSVSKLGSTIATPNTLEGTLYDTKQTRGGTPTNLSQEQFLELLKKFINGGWNQKELSRFYSATTKLYAAQFYIPITSADDAPKAFKCENEVKPSRWIAIYRGKVKAPKTGKFRFAGAGDDILAVQFNKENVFDYGYFQASLGKKTATTAGNEWIRAMKNEPGLDGEKMALKKANIYSLPVTFYQYASTPHWNRELGGIATGKTFSVTEGQVYPIEILISEIPGGKFGMTLLIEEVGMKPIETDKKTGSPILPLFRTNYGVPMRNGQESVPFDEVGIVWEVVK